MNKVDSPRCNFCFLFTQSICHLFYECISVKNLWTYLEKYVGRTYNKQIKFNPDVALFGIKHVEDKNFELKINRIILYVKYFIFKEKLSDRSVNILNLNQYLLSTIRMNII